MMNRFLNWTNLLGVIALAALCVAQWSRQRTDADRIAGLEQTRLRQASQIENDALQLQQNDADLREFRRRIAAADKSLAEKAKQLAAANLAMAQAAAERDGLKTALAKWQAAVGERDAAIATLNSQTKQLTAERDAAIVKYNALVSQSNASATATTNSHP